MTKAFLSCFKKASAATLTSPECCLTVYPCYYEFATVFPLLYYTVYISSAAAFTYQLILFYSSEQTGCARWEKEPRNSSWSMFVLSLKLKIDGFSEKRVRFGVRALCRCSSRNDTHMICDSIFNVDYRAKFVRGVDKRSQQLWRNVYTWDLIRHENGGFNV